MRGREEADTPLSSATSTGCPLTTTPPTTATTWTSPCCLPPSRAPTLPPSSTARNLTSSEPGTLRVTQCGASSLTGSARQLSELLALYFSEVRALRIQAQPANTYYYTTLCNNTTFKSIINAKYCLYPFKSNTISNSSSFTILHTNIIQSNLARTTFVDESL